MRPNSLTTTPTTRGGCSKSTSTRTVATRTYSTPTPTATRSSRLPASRVTWSGLRCGLLHRTLGDISSVVGGARKRIHDQSELLGAFGVEVAEQHLRLAGVLVDA